MTPITVNLESLKLPIYGMDPVTVYGQFYQDLFVIAMTQGKQNGTYLEIGCGWPAGGGTNTFALETAFGWSGVSIDSGRDYNLANITNGHSLAEDWKHHRPNANFVQADATALDYSSFPKYFDYLQVDIDPAVQSLSVLKKITEHIRFSVITFEHDYQMITSPDPEFRREFIDNKNHLVRMQSREYLESLGYVMVIPNINNAEDWWVDPKIIPMNVIDAYATPVSYKSNSWNHSLLQ